MKQNILWLLLFVVAGLASCRDDDPIGVVEMDNLLQYEFPQGTNEWDKEIEQIAKDWGMYIIYKDIDSMALNMTWSTRPTENDPVLVAEPITDEEVPVYLDLVKNYLLANMDNTKKEDLQELPYYFYFVKDLNDGNPNSATYQQMSLQIYKEGFNYWALSFTSEDLEGGLSAASTHKAACAFTYPGLQSRFRSGEYVVPAEFASISDYETRVGIRYVSLEDYIAQYGEMLGTMMYEYSVGPDEKDEVNYYRNRGFAPVVSENFEIEQGMYNGCPEWLLWILYIEEPDWGIFESRNPNLDNVPDVEGRILEDFLNMIRLAMLYPEERMREEFPVDVENALEAEGNRMVMEKYDIVVNYMKDTYNVDLQAVADILQEQ